MDAPTNPLQIMCLVGKNADNLPFMNTWTSKVNKVNDFGLLFAEMSSIAQAFFAFFLSA